MPTRFLIASLAATLTAAPAAWAVTAPFTETFDGGVYTVGTPVFNTDDDGAPTVTLENNALTVSTLVGGRGAILYDVPDATPVPGRSFTQSVEFTVPTVGSDMFIDNVSRLGFVFGVSSPETSTLGPSDAVYIYLKEPSGFFDDPFIDISWFDETEFLFPEEEEASNLISTNSSDFEFNGLPEFLVGDTTYTLGATVTINDDGTLTTDVTLDEGGTSLVDYSFTLAADLGERTLDGTHHGLYLRNFDDNAEVIFDNWSFSTALEAESLAGDFNANGAVEQGDLDLVLGNWGTATTPASFLANTEGLSDGVDQEELDAVLGNWGASLGSDINPVPESATLAMLSALGALGLRRRGA